MVLSVSVAGGYTWYKVNVTYQAGGTFNQSTQGNGWIRHDFVNAVSGGSSPSPTTPPTNPTTSPGGSGTLQNGYISLQSGFVNIRSDRSTNSTPLGSLYLRDPVLYYSQELSGINGDSNKWFKIEKPMTGYVASSYIKSGGNAGGSSTTSDRYPFCATCQRAMYDYTIISSITSINANGGALRKDVMGNYVTYYPAVARFNYRCANHPTSSTFDGPAVIGYTNDTKPITATFSKGNIPPSF